MPKNSIMSSLRLFNTHIWPGQLEASLELSSKIPPSLVVLKDDFKDLYESKYAH